MILYDHSDIDGGDDHNYDTGEEGEKGKYISSGEYRESCDRNSSF